MMHSIGMRTVRCSGRLLEGRLPRGGCVCPRGGTAQGGCLPRGAHPLWTELVAHPGFS